MSRLAGRTCPIAGAGKLDAEDALAPARRCLPRSLAFISSRGHLQTLSASLPERGADEINLLS